jgi:glycosyltransferase involved in cell wall biosynthesis
VITLSESSRRDIARIYGLPTERVAVTPLAAADHFQPSERAEREPALARLGVPGPYLLAVGNLQPRKNLARLLEAFRNAIADRGDYVHLVIVGPRKWADSPIHRAAASDGLNGRVHLLGYVTPGDLRMLYGGATALVYPSLYEGFGLPVLEAMACGTPVICSNRPSLPEVAGDAALLIDPTDTGAIARAMTRVLDDATFRADLHERSLKRSAQFSWTDTARLTRDVYRAAVRSRQ